VLLAATFLLLALAAPVMRSKHREAGRR